MPVALTESLHLPAVPHPSPKRWTRAECAEFENAGLWAGQHLELIEGELINKTGKNQPHALALPRVIQCLVEIFGWKLVIPEAPINVAPEDHPTSEPEPDVIVLKRMSDDFRTQQPKPQDLALLIEIADTILRFDLTTKAALYARAGIQDYWVLDLNGRRLIVHRTPESGRYKSVVAYSENEHVSSLAAPESRTLVGDLLA